MPLQIVRATSDDWVSVRAIRLEALELAPLAFASTLDREQKFSDETWRQRAESNLMFLAKDTEHVVGTATGYVDSSDGDGIIRLVAMYVQPGSRGLGCAHRLIDAVVAAAVAAGAERMLLDVTDVNPTAARCYRRYGFFPTGRTLPLPHLPRITEVEMELDLSQRDRTELSRQFS